MLNKPKPPCSDSKQNILMLQVAIYETRLPGILDDNEIHRAASCAMLDPATSHAWMVWPLQHAATRCDTLRHAATLRNTP